MPFIQMSFVGGGKSLDGAFDITVDNLEVLESSDLKGKTQVDNNVTLYNQEFEISLSAANLIETYDLYMPPISGLPGQVLATDGVTGNLSWSTITSTGGVSFVGMSVPVPFTVNGAASDSITSTGTFLLGFTSTGTGDLVLATSPTLVTPIIGEATGTSLNLSGLTESSAVATDDSKNLVSITNTGTGNNVLATSPTLVTPVLGEATGTSLNLSGSTTTTRLSNTYTGTVTGVGLGEFFAPNIESGSDTYIIIGKSGSLDEGILLSYKHNTTVGSRSLGFAWAGKGPIIEIFNNAQINLNGPVTINGVTRCNNLTASSALATDASKNLVSITNTGTGNNVLATSPTLVTPVLGEATGTSLNLTSLTASSALATDASKNLVSITNTGTGNNVLANSPTLVTPIISGLTASAAVATDSSNNLVSIANTGTGQNVLSILPIISSIVQYDNGTNIQPFIISSPITQPSVLGKIIPTFKDIQLTTTAINNFLIPEPPGPSLYGGNIYLNTGSVGKQTITYFDGGLAANVIFTNYQILGIPEPQLPFPFPPVPDTKSYSGEIILSSVNQSTVSSHGNVVLKSGYDMLIDSEYLLIRTTQTGLDPVRNKIRFDTNKFDAFATSFNFFTPAVVLEGGGIDSYIAGTIAWNAVNDFEATAAGAADIKGASNAKIWGGGYIDIFCRPYGASSLSLLSAESPPTSSGDIYIKSDMEYTFATFVVPPFFLPWPAWPIAAPLGSIITKIKAGDIKIESNNSGGVFIKGKYKGVTIESVADYISYTGVKPVIFYVGLGLAYNPGIYLNANEGPLRIDSSTIRLTEDGLFFKKPIKSSTIIEAPLLLPTPDSLAVGMLFNIKPTAITYISSGTPTVTIYTTAAIQSTSISGPFVVDIGIAAGLIVEAPTSGGGVLFTKTYAIYTIGKICSIDGVVAPSLESTSSTSFLNINSTTKKTSSGSSTSTFTMEQQITPTVATVQVNTWSFTVYNGVVQYPVSSPINLSSFVTSSGNLNGNTTVTGGTSSTIEITNNAKGYISGGVIIAFTQTPTDTTGTSFAVTITVLGGINTYKIGSQIQAIYPSSSAFNGNYIVIGGNSTQIVVTSTITTFDLLGATIKSIDSSAGTVTGSSITLTVPVNSAAVYIVGNRVNLQGFSGTGSINGIWAITSTTATTVTVFRRGNVEEISVIGTIENDYNIIEYFTGSSRTGISIGSSIITGYTIGVNSTNNVLSFKKNPTTPLLPSSVDIYDVFTPTSSATTGTLVVNGGAGINGSVTISGACIITGGLISGGLITPTINVSGLTASSAVATDSSKNLVSITNTGTGNNVLATSPTLNDISLTGSNIVVGTISISTSATTPLVLESLAASGLVSLSLLTPNMTIGGTEFTFGRSITGTGNCALFSYDFQGLGNGGNSLEIGLGTGWNSNFGLVMFGNGNVRFRGLTASSAVATDASKNLISVSNTGTGSNVLATSPSINSATLTGLTISGEIRIVTGPDNELSIANLASSRIVYTASGGRLDVLPQGTTGQVLTSQGPSTAIWTTPTTGSVSSVAMTVPSILTVTGSPITAFGTFEITTTVAPTGSGAIVLATSPTLVTPVLGEATGTSLNLSGSTTTTRLSNTYTGTVTGVGLGEFFAPNIESGSDTYIIIGKSGSLDEGILLSYKHNTTVGSRSLGFAWAGRGTIIEIFNNAQINLNGPVTINGVTRCNNLTASSALATDASKNLVSITNTGTGNNVLATSPTLVTPIIGEATGTSLNLTSLTASSALATDASKNLVSITNTGTGNNVLATSPTLANLTVTTSTPSLYSLTATSTPAVSHGNVIIQSPNLNNNTTSTMFIGRTESVNNGLYVSWNNVTSGAASNSMTFTIVGAGSSIELASNITYHYKPSIFSSTVTCNNLTESRSVFTDASKNLVSRIGGSSGFYTSSALTPLPHNTWVAVGNITTVWATGSGLLTWVNQNTGFRNDTGQPVLVNISWSSRRDTVSTLLETFLRITARGSIVAQQDSNSISLITVSASVYLNPSETILCEAYQNTGFGNDFGTVRITINTHPFI